MKERTSKDMVKDLEAWKASKDVRIKVEVHNLSRCCDTVTWPLGRVSLLSPLGRVQGGSHAPNPYIISSRHHIRARVLLKSFCREQFAARSVCETPTCELNHSSAIFQIVFFLVLACVFDSQAGISPRGEVNRAVHG
jgi:hypothetical protein